MMRSLLFAVVSALLLACAQQPDAGPSSAQLAQLYEDHAFFRLSEELASASRPLSRELQFYQAVVFTAFNRLDDADALAERILTAHPDSPRAADLLDMRMSNELKRYRYSNALAAARDLTSDYPDADPETLDDARNLIHLLRALKDTPAQEVVRHGDTHLEMKDDEYGGRCIPVEIAGQQRCFILDSGANFSVLIRSEAKALGLETMPSGLTVDSANGLQTSADVAVAHVLQIGRLEFHHVVFLVFPDAAFTFGDFQLRGILGFQIFSGMGAVTHLAGDVLQIPAKVPYHPVHNLAQSGMDLLTEVTVGQERLLCQFDTGADRTVFYDGYYQLDKSRIEKSGTLQETKTGSAGGVSTFKAYKVPAMTLTVAGQSAILKDVMVYTEPVRPKSAYLLCSLGQDLVRQFSGYTIDLVNMKLELTQ